jgi:general secretion pathway protein B
LPQGAAIDPARHNEMKGNVGEVPPEDVVRTAAVVPQGEQLSDRLPEKPETMPVGDINKASSKAEAQSRTQKVTVATPSPPKKESAPTAAGFQSGKDENLKPIEAPAKGTSLTSDALPAPSAGMEKQTGKRPKAKLPTLLPKAEPENSNPSEYPKELLEALLNSKDKAPLTQSPSVPPPAISVPLPSGEKGIKPGVPTLRDLPLDVQLKVPKMSFSVFVYAQKPADRMVIIDGHTRREGDEVSSGLRLEEITREGAVFSFKGHRFLQRVF